jgi:hypothetical protein
MGIRNNPEQHIKSPVGEITDESSLTRFVSSEYKLYIMLQHKTRYRLADISDTQTGLTVRDRLTSTDFGGVPAIQLRDLASDGRVNLTSLDRYPLAGVASKFLVGPGDVVFRSRGNRNTATLIDDRLNEPAVALLPIVIIRSRRELVEPAFLAWAINQQPSQRQLDGKARGTSMRMILKGDLDNLEIDIPDLSTQRRIVELAGLAEREHELAMLVADKRKLLIAMNLATYLESEPARY